MVIEIKREVTHKSPVRKNKLVANSASDAARLIDHKPKSRTRAPNGTFDRTEYQRLYMQAKREMKRAGVDGVTVKQWQESKR
jgi:hypothetical protein